MSVFSQALVRDNDSRAAALEASRRALAGLGGAAAEAVFVFCSDGYDAQAVMGAVDEVFGGQVPVAGCSAPGVFSGGRVTHDGVAITALAGTGIAVAPAAEMDVASDSRGRGATAVERALDALEHAGAPSAGSRAVVVLLPDGIAGNSVEVVRGAVDVVGPATRIAGGGSGDDLKFVSAHQFCGGVARSGSALAVGIAAPGPVGVSLRHGCRPAGPAMQTTAGGGRVIDGLDFGNAFERYRDVAADLGAGEVTPDSFTGFAMLHPLGLVQAGGEHVLRSPLQVTPEGSITCCSDIPPNALVRLMAGDRDSMLEATREAAREALAQLGGRPAAGALLFGCISRDAVLGSDADTPSAEVQAVTEVLGSQVPVFGCLTFGGFGALGGGLAQYHSKSVNLCVFAES